MDLGIRGRTALITAASRGIGRACALTLAREGANIVISARGNEDLQAAAADIRSKSEASVVAVSADVTRPDDIRKLVSAANESFGHVDILVAIGGSPPMGSMADIREDQFRDAFEMTVMPLVRLLNAVLPSMRKNKWGRVVTVQSRSVREPISDLVLSNATRPGAAGLIKHLSLEAAADGVLMNTVLPGRIATHRLRNAAGRSGQSPSEFMASQAKDLPIRRLGEAQEVADVVVFLASERAGYVTGVAVPVDGGLIRSI